jgi:hypothetical protein
MKIKIFRKKTLKENCGGPVEPLPDMEAEPTATGDMDISSMTPEDAYEEGRRVAMGEMQTTLTSLMAPVEPAEMEVAVPDQLEEEEGESTSHGYYSNK